MCRPMPTVYYPPPAYVYNPYAPLITFGVGIAVGAILANNCNWGMRRNIMWALMASRFGAGVATTGVER